MKESYIIDNRPRAIDWERRGETVERKLQNARNLLRIQMGEVPYDRLRGFDPAIYYLTLDDMRDELVPELDRVMLWESDVEVADATAIVNDDGVTIIEVTVEVDPEILAERMTRQ